MRRALERGMLAGYDPEIGQWLWALEDIRRRLLRTVLDLEHVYHLLEHEAGHVYQISSIVAHRAASNAVME